MHTIATCLERFIEHKLFAWLLGILFLVLSFFLIHSAIQEGHNWSSDSSLYISQAQALSSQTTDSLLVQNTYTMTESVEHIGPYAYPYGFPAMLSPLVAAGGLDFVRMKYLCAFFLWGSALMVYWLYRSLVRYKLMALIIALDLVIHASFVTFTDMVLSDLPFLMLLQVGLLCIAQSGTLFRNALLGLSIVSAYFVRDIGMVLLPTFMVYQFQYYYFQKNKLVLMPALVPYMLFGLGFLMIHKLLPSGGQNHVDLLLAVDYKKWIPENIVYYHRLIQEYFFYHTGGFLFWLGFYLIVLVGQFFNGKKHLYLTLFFYGYSLIYLCWPFHQGLRFIFPLLPLLFFFFINGLVALVRRSRVPVFWVPLFLLAAFIVRFFIAHQEVAAYSKVSSNTAYNAEMKAIYHFVQEHTKATDTIAFFKPRTMRLFTNRHTVYYDVSAFKSKPSVSYLVVNSATNYPLDTKDTVLLKTQHYQLIYREK